MKHDLVASSASIPVWQVDSSDHGCFLAVGVMKSLCFMVKKPITLVSTDLINDFKGSMMSKTCMWTPVNRSVFITDENITL